MKITNEKALLDALDSKMRKAVRPFLKEYKALTKGIVYEIEVAIQYPGQLPPQDEVRFVTTVKVMWMSDVTGQFEVVKSSADSKIYTRTESNIVALSPQMADFNRRISTLLSEMEAKSSELFGGADIIWDSFFDRLDIRY